MDLVGQGVPYFKVTLNSQYSIIMLNLFIFFCFRRLSKKTFNLDLDVCSPKSLSHVKVTLNQSNNSIIFTLSFTFFWTIVLNYVQYILSIARL